MSVALHDVRALAEATDAADVFTENYKRAEAFRDNVLPAMESLRKAVDGLESGCAKQYWPYPSYGDILFSVK